MAVVDCVERMMQFKQRCPGAEFDLKPNMFTARVPGRACLGFCGRGDVHASGGG